MVNQPRIQAVIFDKDGVLSDSERLKARAWDDVLQFCGVAKGLGERWYFGHLGPTANVLAQHAIDTFQFLSNQSADELAIAWNKRYRQTLSEVKPISENVSLLVELSQIVPVAVASSMDAETIVSELTRFGCRDAVSVIVSGEDVEHNKPAPDVYVEATRALGIEPRFCIAIEDSAAGVTAARSAGITCIGYVHPAYQADLSDADVICADLHQCNLLSSIL